jgi:hypothetical protein
MFAVFNQNKNFISFSNEKFDGDFLFKEIPENQSNMFEWRWEGNYDDGQMVKLSESFYSDELSETGFKNKYPIPLMLSILFRQVFIISEKLNITDYQFNELVKDFLNTFENEEEYISLLKIANKIKKYEKE